MNIEKLNNFLRQLDRNYDINAGGCCFVAFCLAAQCKHYGIPYSIVAIGDYNISKYTLRYNLRTNSYGYTNDEVGNHYFLKVNGEYVNKGDFLLSRYCVNECKCVEPEHILQVYRDGYWNDMYNSENNLRIYKLIKNYFRNEEKERTSSR